jgi:hypothetical protein
MGGPRSRVRRDIPMRTIFAFAGVLGLLLVAAAPQESVKAAEKSLQKAIKEQNRKDADTSIAALVTANSQEAMKILLAAASKPPARKKEEADKEDPFWSDTYWTLLSGASSFLDPAALGELGEFILKYQGKPVARDAMAMVCNRGQKPLVGVCLKILEKGPDEFKIMAADHLQAIGDKSCVEPLLRALKAGEKSPGELRLRIGRALMGLTGQDYGDNVSNWEGWWEKNKDKEWEIKAHEPGGSTGTATDALDRGRATEVERVRQMGKLLILQAGDKCKCKKNHDLDNIDQITIKMGLPTETITKEDLDKRDDLRLSDYVAVLANCTQIFEHCVCPLCKPGPVGPNRMYRCVCPIDKHENVKYVLTEKAVKRLKAYVEGGGYLFAEDWCMEDFVERAFGDYVGHGSLRPDETVSVQPKAGAASHPYLRKIFFKPPRETTGTVSETDLDKLSHQWKIDKDTKTIKIKDPKKVVTLLSSPELAKSSQGDDAVAVTFGVLPDPKPGEKVPAGKPEDVISQDRKKMTGGRVLYVLSHFGKQVSQDDEYSLQNLLLNFLVEANERRGFAPAGPAKKP